MLVLDDTEESAGRKARMTFPLTPLADAMFQLLVFFMLSAGLSPYSLLILQSGTSSAANEDARAAPPQATPSDPAAVASWTLDASRIIANGQEFDYTDGLPRLVAALEANEIAQVILIATADASVQDLALVLEALQTSTISQVQLVRLGP